MAILRPVSVLRRRVDINPSHDIELVPIIESDKLFALNAKQSSSEDAFILKVSLESLMLSEVLKNLNSTTVALYCVYILVQVHSGPY